MERNEPTQIYQYIQSKKIAETKLIEAYPILAAHWPNFQEVFCHE